MIKIDTDAATRFEQTSKTRRETLNVTAATIRSRLASAGLSTQVADLMSDLAGHVETSGTTFGDAARRATSADDQGAAALSVQFPALSITAFNKFLPAGVTPAELAEAQKVANDLKNDPTDPKKQQAAIAFMKANMDNPELMKEFIQTVGPKALLQIPADLAANFEAKGYNNPSYYKGYESLEAKRKEMMQAQEDLMGLLGQALATATDKGGLDPKKFGGQLADLAIGDDRHGPYTNDTNAWALSQLLKNGDYHKDFLLTIANKLDNYERNESDGRKNMWRNRLGTNVGMYVLGNDRAPGYYDPMVGLFQAMGRTPDAALSFLYGSGADPKRAKYYIQDRKWAHDDYNAIGEFLDGAATAHRGPIDKNTTPHEANLMALSSKAASDAVKYLAARKDPIGAGGADSIGHLLANYIAEIDYLAGGHVTTPNSWGKEPNAALYAGYPPIAQMTFDDVQKLLTQVLPNDAALEQVTEATNALAQIRLNIAVNANRNKREEIKTAIQKNGLLGGFIVGAAGLGSDKLATEQQARQKALLDLIGSGLTSIPIPGGPLVGFIANQAVNKGKDWVSDGLGDPVAEAKDEKFEYKTELQNQLKIKIGLALGEAGLLDEQTRTDGTTYDWFVDGKFDPAIAKANPDAFVEYLVSADSGWTSEIGETDDKIGTGVDRGKKDD